MNDDQLELASAYLDGEATTDERAVVESDPQLLAEVDRLRAVRAALGDVEPPLSPAREAAVAAALAVFDERPASTMPSTPGPSAPTNVIPIEHRRRLRRWQGLSAAAAAIVIVGGGIAITRRGGDDTLPSSDQRRESTPMFEAPAVSQPVDTKPPVVSDVAATDAPMMAVTPTTAAEQPSDAAADEAEVSQDQSAEIEAQASQDQSAEAGAESDAAAPPAAGAPADTAVGAIAPPSTTPPAPAAPPATTVAVGQVVIEDDDDLVEFAESMKTEPTDIDVAEDACEDGTLKADAVYEDDDGSRRAIVVVTVENDRLDLGALSLDDCEIVLRVERAAD